MTAAAFVSLGAFTELTALLDRALKTPMASANAPLSGASRSSLDQIRGEAHASDDSVRPKADRAPWVLDDPIDRDVFET